jgi:phage terminase large subunit
MTTAGITTKRRLEAASAAVEELRQQVLGEQDLSVYRDRPVEFVREVLGADPWARQEEILRALATTRGVTVRSCHSSGKTWLAARAVLWWLQTRPGAVVVTTAPTWHQVKDLLWREIRAAFFGSRARLRGTCLQTELSISDRWFARGLSTNEPVNFQGFHSPHLMFVADEASGVDEAIYEAAQGFLTQAGARFLLIGNPNFAAGTFYESHQSERFDRHHISAFDVPSDLVTREWIEERREEWGEESPAYQVRVLGEFPLQGEDSLINMAWVTAAQQRDLLPGTPTVIGVDVAYYGGDESVAYVRQGSRIVDAAYWRGNDTQQSAGRVIALGRRWRPEKIQVDNIGVGAGVVDRLLEEGWPAEGINVGQAAADPDKYFNRRTEVFFLLQERFRDGDIQVPAEDVNLLAQLTSLRFAYTGRGQYKLESKEDMRKRGLKSPDRADALALTFAPPQKKVYIWESW